MQWYVVSDTFNLLRAHHLLFLNDILLTIFEVENGSRLSVAFNGLKLYIHVLGSVDTIEVLSLFFWLM